MEGDATQWDILRLSISAWNIDNKITSVIQRNSKNKCFITIFVVVIKA